MRKAPLVALAIAAFLAGAAAWLALSGRPAAARAAEDASGARAAAEERAARRPRERAAPSEGAHEPAVAAPSVASVAVPAAPGRVRVPVTILRTFRAAPRVEEPGEHAGPPNGTGFGLLPGRTWHPLPAKGAATLRGRVVDEDGAPLPRATVYRFDVAKGGDPSGALSGRWLEEVAQTDEFGAFAASAQPAGDWLVAAQWEGHMSRSEGLARDGAVRVTLGAEPGTCEVLVRLPLRRRELATLEVAVTGEAGDPLHGVQVECAQTAGSPKGGTCRLDGIPAGRRRVVVTATGYRPVAREADFIAGATVRIAIALQREDRGPHEVRGRVVDETGAGVAAADVYLASGLRGRWTRADAEGRFRFAGLGDRWAQETFGLAVSPVESRDIESVWRDGLRAGSDEIVLSVRRTTPVFVRIADAATGDPIALFDVRAEAVAVADGAARRVPVFGMSFHEEDGEAEVRLAAGRYVLTVEAKDHLGAEVEVEVPPGTGAREILVSLPVE
jgi:protocatechuate 3,4-dioxygenase beta subunit